MHEQAFTTLEYDELRALISRGAQTPMGRARLEQLTPVADLNELRRALSAVGECVQLRGRGVSWVFSELRDPDAAVARLQIEAATLEPAAILEISRLCEQALSARASILAEREACPVLWQIVAGLPRELHSLTARISNKILPNGELDDRASPELARIRHEITRLRSNITRALESLMRRSDEAIQDELVTLRNDRFVIPVKSDHRARVQGVAHGFSSSGATVFVEPLETIDANNELQSLREAEEREIARILFLLTDELRSQLPGIEIAANAVAELDFINAKAAFHYKFDCAIPEIDSAAVSPNLESGGFSDSAASENAEILTGAASAGLMFSLEEARHPLLEESLRSAGSSVVPVSFSLEENNNTMVISGANAGGKTVVLKTAGLLSLMALSGLPLPARKARVPFYASVLADIGDHQSLTANLSTFTSHVANITRMIEFCRAPALVLLDEVGTGTDPEEGSALGVAVVDHFRKVCGAYVLATTHYSGLKMYAANEAGVLNASVEFDDRTLKPTYRLMVGVAGASAGLEIARRFGIPDEIIGSASALVKDSSLQASEYLSRIRREAEAATTLRQALEEERAAVAEKFVSLDRDAEKRERERQTSFQRELAQSVAQFERQSSELVATIEDRVKRIKVEREVQSRTAELKRSVAAASAQSRGVRVLRDGQIVQKNTAEKRDVETTQPEEERYVVSQSRPIAVGDRVKLRSFGSIGIVDNVKGDEAEVRVKSLRFREKLANLELVESVAPAKGAGERFAKLRSQPRAEVHLDSQNEEARAELNVIGQTSDEAVDAVDKFLDKAVINSLSQVRIVHGHGTGALRRAIGELVKDHPHVERFSPAPPDQGGAGATIIELKL